MKSPFYRILFLLFKFLILICIVLVSTWDIHFSYVFVRDDIGALVEELVDNTKKLVRATTREMDKWRR